jgi:hypothetical protein
MIQLDSQKHVDICQLVIDLLNWEDLLKEEKQEFVRGLKRHIELEGTAISRANELLKNDWIRQNQGLEWLIKKWRDDEREHHRSMLKLADKRIFRMDPLDAIAALKGTEFVEERYRKYAKKMLRRE